MTSIPVKIYRLQHDPIQPMPVMGFCVSERVYLRIAIEDERGHRFVDCSPLPHLHPETREECFEAAREYFLKSRKALPISLQSSLDFLDFEGRGKLPGRWENSALVSLGQSVPASARVCKIKIGHGDLSGARAYLEALVKDRPDRQFRLDCNQLLEGCSLPDIKALIEGLPVAYIEEPFRSIDKLKAIARELPIALDESLGADPQLDRLAKAWILKPNVIGYAAFVERLQDRSPIQKVLSNAFESFATLQLYAYVYRSLVRDPQALGYGTAFYFEDPSSEWNPRVFEGDWPCRPFSEAAFEGELLWNS